MNSHAQSTAPDCSMEALLEERLAEHGPVRVAIAGAGAAGCMVIRHLVHHVPWLRVVAIVGRDMERLHRAVDRVGGVNCQRVSSLSEWESCLAAGEVALVTTPELVSQSLDVELVVEVSGTVESAARLVGNSLEAGKHVVLLNAELDATLGPILRARAQRKGVVYTHTDGEEPGVAMRLIRYLRMTGLKPLAAGNLKGMIDRYRTPETQRAFADKHGLNPAKAASFADGTKLALESCILANAAGFRVCQRGMLGPACKHVNDVAAQLGAARLLGPGIIDYALGAEPYSGAFVVVHEEDPERRRELAYFKMGEGPFYVFYTPFHLPHIQVASTIARAALQHDATVAPVGSMVCEVITVAKRGLKAGEVLDGVGGFLAYGLIDNVPVCRSADLLPMGLSGGATLVHDVTQDQPITFADVQLPSGRLSMDLWLEQQQYFAR